jgi:hypothetical protein
MNSMDSFIAKGATSWSIKCINGFVECLVPIESQYLVISLTIEVNWDHQLRFLTIQIVNLRELEFHWNWLWCQFLPFGIISMNFRHFRIISVGFSWNEIFFYPSELSQWIFGTSESSRWDFHEVKNFYPSASPRLVFTWNFCTS